MNDDDQNGWQLAEPFDIDNGELDGVSSVDAFTLGVEWATWRNRIIAGDPKTDLCLSQNAARIVLMLERHGWFCEERRRSDWDEGWREIWVGDRKPAADE